MTEIYAKHGRVEVRPYALSDAQAWLTANKDVLPLQNKFDFGQPFSLDGFGISETNTKAYY